MEDVRREDLVGLTFAEASELAEAQGWTVRRLRPGSIVTMEYRADRLNLHVGEQDDVVVDVRQG